MDNNGQYSSALPKSDNRQQQLSAGIRQRNTDIWVEV
jgi:hypothetical protein